MDANIFLQGDKQGNTASETWSEVWSMINNISNMSLIFQLWAWTKEFPKEEIREEKNKENSRRKQNVIIYAHERNVKMDFNSLDMCAIKYLSVIIHFIIDCMYGCNVIAVICET